MNRIDELTDRLIDSALTPSEATELDALLARDPEGRARHLKALRLELVLRETRTEFDLAEATVARIEATRLERTTAAVMAEIAPRRARHLRTWSLFAVLAASVLVALWFSQLEPAPAPEPPAVPATHEMARLAAVTGSVEVVGPGGISAARLDQTLAPGHTLRTLDDESVAVLEFPDHSRIEVHAESSVRALEPAGNAPRKVVLIEGRVTAVATGRLLVIGSGAAEVEANRGSFALWSSGAGSARVESLGGDVRVVRIPDAEPLTLVPGRTAIVRDEQTPVRVEASSRVDSAPLARLNFMALDARFTPEGDVVAVSAKQWAKWTPGSPDPGRTALLPKVSNDGLAAFLTSDLHAVAICRTDDREDRISIRALPSGEEIGRAPVRVPEPRLMCIAPDASWIGTLNATKTQGRTVRVWDGRTGAERFWRESANGAFCLAASPDSRWVAVGSTERKRSADDGVTVFDAATGDRVFGLPTLKKVVTAVAFSADMKFVAVGFNGAIQVWNVPERTLVSTLEGFERVVSQLAFDPQATMLAAGTQDGQVWVWSADSWRRRQVMEAGPRGVRSLAFRHDGKRLVSTANKGGIAVWEIAPEPASPE